MLQSAQIAAAADRGAEFHVKMMENVQMEHDAKMAIFAQELHYIATEQTSKEEEHQMKMEILRCLKTRMAGEKDGTFPSLGDAMQMLP